MAPYACNVGGMLFIFPFLWNSSSVLHQIVPSPFLTPTLWIWLSQRLNSLPPPLWRHLPDSFSVRRRLTLRPTIFTLWPRIFTLRARIFALRAADISCNRALVQQSTQFAFDGQDCSFYFCFTSAPRIFLQQASILRRGGKRACSLLRSPLIHCTRGLISKPLKGMQGYNGKKCLFHFHKYFYWASEATQ